MRSDPQPNPRFTGLFIPAEILDIPDLTHTDCMLLAWIDALHSKEYHGCFASNAWFSQKLKLKENTVKILISKLKEKGLIEQVSFDGRIRVLRACKEKWFKSESTSDVDLNQPQTLILINPCGLKESTSPLRTYNIESKEEIKDTNTPPTPKGERVCFGSHVKLYKEEHEKLCLDYGKDRIDSLIDEMNDYCASKPKIYKDYAAAIRQWIRNRKQDKPLNNYQTQQIDRRTKNRDGTPIKTVMEDSF